MRRNEEKKRNKEKDERKTEKGKKDTEIKRYPPYSQGWWSKMAAVGFGRVYVS